MTTTRCVRIKVRGRLGDRLASAFDGMTLQRGDGTTELVGQVADQAQLHGILTRIRDLGIELESVTTGRSASGPEGSEREAHHDVVPSVGHPH